MGKGGSKRKAARKRIAEVQGAVPTNEAMRHGDFERAGIAYRRIPAIDTLRNREVITIREHVALAHYREAFIACEKSSTRSCLDNSPKGSGAGPSPSALRSALKLARLEGALGALTPITRYIAGEDNSLSQWAIKQGGCKGSGHPVCLPKSKELELARIDLKFAASRLIGEMEA